VSGQKTSSSVPDSLTNELAIARSTNAAWLRAVLNDAENVLEIRNAAGRRLRQLQLQLRRPRR
jgi:hypothetical protein